MAKLNTTGTTPKTEPAKDQAGTGDETRFKAIPLTQVRSIANQAVNDFELVLRLVAASCTHYKGHKGITLSQLRGMSTGFMAIQEAYTEQLPQLDFEIDQDGYTITFEDGLEVTASPVTLGDLVDAQGKLEQATGNTATLLVWLDKFDPLDKLTIQHQAGVATMVESLFHAVQS